VSEQVIELYEGYRENIHPKLKVLDDIDCQVFYNRNLKYFHIEYDRDIDAKGVVYNKAILSTDPISISDMIEDYKTWVKEGRQSADIKCCHEEDGEFD